MMKSSFLSSLVIAQLVLCTLIGASASRGQDATESCYYIPLPDVPVSDANRTVPWGEPTIHYPNGTTCCSSLDQVGTALDDIDVQLLQLLATRTTYIREAVRFISSEADHGDTSREQHVMQNAIDGALALHLPQIVAQMAYQGIWNASVLFEKCIFNTYDSC